MSKLSKALKGCILGAAVGDSLGLTVEGMTRTRQARMFPHITGHRFLGKRGMVSDDTEHTLLVAQALTASGGELEAFPADLARRLKWWVAALPAGVGPATLRACLRLLIGFSHKNSGVFSAGNGPAMRSAIIGAAYGHDPEKMKSLVLASTLITHKDPKAFYGALAVAQMAAFSAQGGLSHPQDFLRTMAESLEEYDSSEFISLCAKAAQSAKADHSVARFLETMNQPEGVGNYVYHTVPAVLQCWFRRPLDFRGAALEMVRAGGDTDTSTSILGAIIGAGVGEAGIPEEWVDGLMEWPRTVDWMRKVAVTLAESVESGEPTTPPGVNPMSVLARNAFFMGVVLAHGFRRAAPPY
ncbi:MAG: ADP-ribosylglycohydrolase family protein [Nitrospinota bacterium]|nr:ADP-ribosylglycohydrolase family protein [Nitrospinota bacterium]MDH5677284.1 ADP-ribosylglycohydrolase family protein [Nitrospinota bacterium]MDH5756219.1 ADP-ribosylglycohydrolase family protein [Nitrospinota bacterium]